MNTRIIESVAEPVAPVYVFPAIYGTPIGNYFLMFSMTEGVCLSASAAGNWSFGEKSEFDLRSNTECRRLTRPITIEFTP